MVNPGQHVALYVVELEQGCEPVLFTTSPQFSLCQVSISYVGVLVYFPISSSLFKQVRYETVTPSVLLLNDIKRGPRKSPWTQYITKK